MVTIFKCGHTCATLRISGEFVDPCATTEALGVSPTKTNKGADYGTWWLSSEGRLLSDKVEEHILWIVDQLRSKVGALQDYRRSDCSVDILCHCDPQPQGAVLCDDTINRLGELGFQLIVRFEC